REELDARAHQWRAARRPGQARGRRAHPAGGEQVRHGHAGARPGEVPQGEVVPVIERRIGLLFLAFCALLVLAGLRALQLGGLKGRSLREKADTQQISQVPVPARRGTITDRKGVELAVSEPADDVAVTPYLIKDPAGAPRRLAPLLHQPQDAVLRKVAQRNTGFVYLVRELPASQAQQIGKLHMPGIPLIPYSRRIYPQRWMAAQLLGAVGTDGNGLSGLEYARDK